jgi:peptide/nickel transport system permease protein
VEPRRHRRPDIDAPISPIIIRRTLVIPVILLVTTVTLFGILTLAPPEARAELYLPSRLPSNMTEEVYNRLIRLIIRENGLNDPFPIQYVRWISGIARGDWGFSPSLDAEILPSLIARVPATAELALYTALFFIPLGLLSGVMAARRPDGEGSAFRLSAFIGTSIPPFILGLWLLAVFLRLSGGFTRAPGPASNAIVTAGFRAYTDLLTLDGLSMERPGSGLDALRHLVLPVLT